MKRKDERGSITLYVLLAMLFLPLDYRNLCNYYKSAKERNNSSRSKFVKSY